MDLGNAGDEVLKRIMSWPLIYRQTFGKVLKAYNANDLKAVVDVGDSFLKGQSDIMTKFNLTPKDVPHVVKAKDEMRVMVDSLKNDLVKKNFRGYDSYKGLAGKAGTGLLRGMAGTVGAGLAGFDLGNFAMNQGALTMGIPQTLGMMENQNQDTLNLQRRAAMLGGK